MDDLPKTNNTAETWHGRINTVHGANLTANQLVHALREEQSKVEADQVNKKKKIKTLKRWYYHIIKKLCLNI